MTLQKKQSISPGLKKLNALNLQVALEYEPAILSVGDLESTAAATAAAEAARRDSRPGHYYVEEEPEGGGEFTIQG